MKKIFLPFLSALDIKEGGIFKFASKRKKTIYIGAYTFLFIIIFTIGYNAFWVNEKSFVGRYDALQQHIIALQYFGQYWRTLIHGLLAGNFQIPMFDFRIGLGNDIFQPMITAGIADIFGLFSMFVPAKHIEVYYGIVVILRPYLAGLAFSALCMYAKQKNWAILIGSLIYSFSGYVLFAGALHPFFIIAMIYAPLLFMGLDMVLRKKNPCLLAISTFLLALTGFYFLYMITIFLTVYVLIRIHHLHGKNFWRQLFPLGLRAISSYLLGLMMSAVLFYPSVLSYFSSPDRDSKWPYKLWFGDADYYISIFMNSVAMFGSWNYMGLAAVVLLILAALIVKKTDKRNKNHLLTFFSFAFILHITPFGGLMMNGFGYTTGRWTFLFTLILSFITVYMLPQMQFLGKRESIAFVILICLYAYFTIFIDNYNTTYTIMALCMLLLATFVILLRNVFKIRPVIFVFLLTNVVVLNLILNTHYLYNENIGNYIEDFVFSGTVKETYSVLPTIPNTIRKTDKSFYRLDMPYNYYPNASTVLNYNGLIEYWSMMNGLISEGFIDYEVFPMRFSFCLRGGFDGRAPLNTLAGVKYFTMIGDQPESVPFGYTHFEKSNGKVDVTEIQDNTKVIKQKKIIRNTYKNKYTLPLGYTYDKVISYDDFQKLYPLDKQEAILQAVVLDDKYKNTPASELQFTSSETPYTYETDGLTWENGILTTEKENSSFTLTFEGKHDSETYVRLSGFDSNNIEETSLYFKTGNVSKSEYVILSNHAYSFYQKNYTCNLGYNKNPKNTVTITISKPGTYTLDDIKVYCYPMKNYPAQVEALKEESLKNIKITTNHVNGDISLSRDKFLTLSIPYSKGWNAKIDGQHTELLQANSMFMALPLTAGEHTIELTYCTPGIKLGVVLSIVGFLIFIGIILFYKKQNLD